ncbi:MAG: antibiotic biosynthesis monooxygenase [Glycomyces artemisiae]|uniref:Antibiotic biosynthesis monooxygenase n=1 Tax=Glycomyces artemisiae TaxID=1076443 RepID=A0A850CG16_9ACTN|nr:antibiotic biosynthesis monooxygenase [Glycomyces artemisiae]
MILRTWSARATAEGADAYRRYFEGVLLAELRRQPGFQGAHLVAGGADGDPDRELMVLTFWESFEAIRAFAGEQFDAAVVEPEAQAVLTGFDRTVVHREVLAAGGP